MQIGVALGFTALYLGASVAITDAAPHNAFVLFIAPPAVALGASIVAEVARSLYRTVPWARMSVSRPPRRVHMTWMAAFRAPMFAPLTLIPWNMIWAVTAWTGLNWPTYLAGVLTAALVSVLLFRRVRQMHLVQHGEMAAAVVTAMATAGENEDDVYYEFTAANGATMTGRAADGGYRIRPGAVVPVFYDKDNPTSHVVACAAWFAPDET
ncbi:MAG TPA: DUF3592 domain-containing protein, partial [Vicinamibacterales bacterium]|nr:DUF3592 domain-containing protein [Vicinamibacterales bacterium]